MTAPVADTPGSRTTWQIAISVETLAYAAIITLALALRAIRLGAAPLSSIEARQALAALDLLRPGVPALGAIESPLLFAGAVVSMAVAGASNAAARWLPMLGGVALVAAPLIFRRRVGRFPALVASAWLAISPVAVSASRRMSGSGLAMLALLLGLAAFDGYVIRRRRASVLLAGVAVGAALLADYGALVALLTVGIGWAFAIATDEEDALTGEKLRVTFAGLPWGTFATGLAGTVALLSTLWLLAPGGLGAAADQLARFLAGFAGRVPGATSPALALAVYHPALLVFGGVGAWLATQSASPWQRFLAGWAIAGLAATLFYPGALPEHALWAAVPLAGLAGIAVAAMVSMRHSAPKWGIWVQAAACVALVAMLFASLTHHLQAPRIFTIPPGSASGLGGVNVPLDLILAALWVVMLVIQWLSGASLWGPRAAWLGTGLGVLALGITLAAGQSGALAFPRAASPYEPANITPAQPGMDRLVQTAQEVGDMAVGNAADASLTVQADSSLAWALRGFHNVSYVNQVDPTVSSVMVITPITGTDPALGSSYVGQDFVVVQSWTPRGLGLANVLRWLFYRTAPTLPEELRVILWVREDVYRLANAGTLPPELPVPTGSEPGGE